MLLVRNEELDLERLQNECKSLRSAVKHLTQRIEELESKAHTHGNRHTGKRDASQEAGRA